MKATILGDTPYADIICKSMYKSFPQFISSKQTLLEVISDIFIGTKDNRFGPVPSPEFQVTMREAIKQAIDKNEPIPVLVPWGSIKAKFEELLDIAELSAIGQLNQLNSMVKQVYPLGLDVVVRIEDTSGFSLFQLEDKDDMVMIGTEAYSKSLEDVITIVAESVDNGKSSHIFRGIRESSMKNAKAFSHTADAYASIMLEYLHDSHQLIHVSPSKVVDLLSYKALVQLGWRGTVSPEQRDYYLNSYKKNYQDWDNDRLMKRLALYLGGSLARHKLDMTGKQSYWDKFIQLAFVPPIQGLPEGYNRNYIYYRTVPLSNARTHMPPWRAKGYLCITRDNVSNKLVSFNDPLVNELEKGQVKLEGANKNVVIQTDYLIKD